MTQEQLAIAAGVGQDYISGLETGSKTRTPGGERAVRLAHALDVLVSELVSGGERPDRAATPPGASAADDRRAQSPFPDPWPVLEQLTLALAELGHRKPQRVLEDTLRAAERGPSHTPKNKKTKGRRSA